MKTINHWSEALDEWEEYKSTHSKEEILADMEEFFSLDREVRLPK